MKPYPKFHPIHSAARSNNIQVFKYLHEKNPKFLLEKDENQSTALHHATSYLKYNSRIEDVEIVKFILERLPKASGSIVDAQDAYGNTPLHLAFLNSNIDILNELVKRKASLNIKNKD